MIKSKINNYRFWHSPVALVVILCICILFAYNIIDLIKKEKETSQKKEFILDQINTLQSKKSSLVLGISKLETEEGREEILREKYQVAKSGEKMVIIVDEDRANVSSKEEVVGHGFLAWFNKIFKF